MARRRRNYDGPTGRLPRDPRRLLLLVLAALVAYGVNWMRERQTARQPRPGVTQRRGGSDAGSLPSAPGRPPTRAGVSAVGTFNIEWFGRGGPKAGRTESDIRAIADVIKGTGAPLLGLEEIGDEETMDRLIRFLPGYEYVLGTSGRNQRCGMLWDTKRARVGRAREWPDINNGLERTAGTLRAPLFAPVRVGDFDFLFVVVHLKALFDEKSMRTRRTQTQRIRARLDEWIAGNADKDVVVVGDFNDFPDSPALAQITGSRTGGGGFVNTGSRLPEGVGTYLGKSGRIDHILVSSPYVSQEEWTDDISVYPKPRGAARKAYEESVSDHLPSWADFRTDRDNDP